jgi:hypothetical protein
MNPQLTQQQVLHESGAQAAIRIALACGMVFSLVASCQAQAQCPTSYIISGCSHHDWLPFECALPAANELCQPWHAGDPCDYGCYDIPHGTLEAHGAGNPWNGDCGFALMVKDEFQVIGPTPGTPLTFFAELMVDGRIETEGEVYAGIGEGWVSAYGLDTRTAGPVSATIRLPLQCLAGEAFVLAVEMGAIGGENEGNAHAVSVLRFSGLPNTASVTSCQNYDLPVPAWHNTWGRLKATYR